MPLRLGFRGRGSARPAGHLSPSRVVGPPVLQWFPPSGTGNPEYRKGLRGPQCQSSLPPASRPRCRSNATPPPRQASSTEASRGSTGSPRRTLLARIRSTAVAEGVGARLFILEFDIVKGTVYILIKAEVYYVFEYADRPTKSL
ncbi:hypothetical protein NDU88_002559 [Pleurodeles waltl]|uniref:Uncharacterized protein n=1 Tax=Pleurodeles waltl TaxID=8319 RepID=A0AAV7NE47_PLEWA|nr:hypothetical protein NDU88_002559 [Pleurodeles waltl]